MALPVQTQPVERSTHRPAAPARGVQPQSVACVTGSVENGSICVNLPMVGKKCVAVGTHVADGASASVCLEQVFPLKVCAHVMGSQFCL